MQIISSEAVFAVKLKILLKCVVLLSPFHKHCLYVKNFKLMSALKIYCYKTTWNLRDISYSGTLSNSLTLQDTLVRTHCILATNKPLQRDHYCMLCQGNKYTCNIAQKARSLPNEHRRLFYLFCFFRTLKLRGFTINNTYDAVGNVIYKNNPSRVYIVHLQFTLQVEVT